MSNGWFVLGAVALAVIVVLGVERRITPRFAAVLALAVGFWVLTAASRAQYHEPAASRYLYPGALFLVLLLGEVVSRVPRPSAVATKVAASAVLLAMVAVAVPGNLDQLRDGGAELRDLSNVLKAQLAAVELSRGRVDPAYRPNVVRAPQISAGPYLRAERDLGSPAFSLHELREQSAVVRNAADVTLVEALGLKPEPIAATATVSEPAPTVVTAAGGVARTEGACVAFEPNAANANVLLRTEGAIVITTSTAPASVGVMLFGAVATPVGAMAPSSTAGLDLPDVDAGAWSVQVVSAAPVRICTRS
jgi:hypothetical protein